MTCAVALLACGDATSTAPVAQDVQPVVVHAESAHPIAAAPRPAPAIASARIEDVKPARVRAPRAVPAPDLEPERELTDVEPVLAPEHDFVAAPAFEPGEPTDELHARALPFVTPSHGWSVAFDVGVPDGATASLVVHPRPAYELAAGISYNGISSGLRVGATWTPWRGWVTPTLSIDYGHYFDGDANPLVRFVTGDPKFSSALLDRVGYDYATAAVGVELGRGALRGYVRAGVSRVTGTIHDLGVTTGSDMMPLGGSEPTVTITMASARVGLLYQFGR